MPLSPNNYYECNLELSDCSLTNAAYETKSSSGLLTVLGQDYKPRAKII